jgi:hypothetical protein
LLLIVQDVGIRCLAIRLDILIRLGLANKVSEPANVSRVRLPISDLQLTRRKGRPWWRYAYLLPFTTRLKLSQDLQRPNTFA